MSMVVVVFAVVLHPYGTTPSACPRPPLLMQKALCSIETKEIMRRFARRDALAYLRQTGPKEPDACLMAVVLCLLAVLPIARSETRARRPRYG